ncbi:putative oxalocrotonate tautomerase [Aspergillus pseudotamarii]|uniref:Putative oxalocrotonate tautomerase n=1 Tax=Aspergillus pseudotamarii TaxID=132259 RepID=A0A5N6T6H9_ASPPS|nr:putative oxalocrotonate tautomerase [Aspergillus pseudotamarii]KAE8141912.1 putative oxalocrotonate tautomerase [Aspergillus pseudotamarii]
MPLWQIYHPPGTFTTSTEKAAFAQAITENYTSVGLPAFYVVVQFHQLDPTNVFVGGHPRPETARPFVRIVIAHIAIRLPDTDAAYDQAASKIDRVLKPHALDKGYDVEYHVDETERRMWKINGLIPPPWKSDAELLWVRENRPVVYEGACSEGERTSL